MHGLIVVTDHDWFRSLQEQGPLDEVNFWRPSDTRRPRLAPGVPVLFKLRKKFGGWIAGWGTFARHDVLPAWLAWEAFEQRNGAPTFDEMRRRIERLRQDGGGKAAASGDYQIGCLLLSEPVFLDRSVWVSPPATWPDNVVQGMGIDLSRDEGARIWEQCRLGAARAGMVATPEGRSFPAERHGQPVLRKVRLGQGIFRIAVMDAYGRACAVTSEHSLPALEAAHIRPFEEGGEHDVSNGLLLRSDIHKLFDRGYVGVDPDLRFVVSKRLKDDYANGRSYYPLHGQSIRLPNQAEERPGSAWLEWHLGNRYKG